MFSQGDRGFSQGNFSKRGFQSTPAALLPGPPGLPAGVPDRAAKLRFRPNNNSIPFFKEGNRRWIFDSRRDAEDAERFSER